MNTKYARRLRKNLTEAERHLWAKLRDRQLLGCKFRRQVPIGAYIVDFLCIEENLILEVDGGQHNSCKRDVTRDAYLRTQGFAVLRFWNNDMLSNTQGVLETIVAHLKRAPL